MNQAMYWCLRVWVKYFHLWESIRYWKLCSRIFRMFRYEVGQYVGTDTDMLLNLQSLTEKIGSEREGKIWVICTGQEAIDEIIKVRADEFSHIQARFRTYLSKTLNLLTLPVKSSYGYECNKQDMKTAEQLWTSTQRWSIIIQRSCLVQETLFFIRSRMIERLLLSVVPV